MDHIELKNGSLTLESTVDYAQVDAGGMMIEHFPIREECYAVFKNDKVTIKMAVIPVYWEGRPRYFEAVMNDEVQGSEQLELQRDQEARLPRRPRSA